MEELWGISSAGLERCLDRAEVTGSNPVYPTNEVRDITSLFLCQLVSHDTIKNAKSFKPLRARSCTKVLVDLYILLEGHPER